MLTRASTFGEHRGLFLACTWSNLVTSSKCAHLFVFNLTAIAVSGSPNVSRISSKSTEYQGLQTVIMPPPSQSPIHSQSQPCTDCFQRLQAVHPPDLTRKLYRSTFSTNTLTESFLQTAAAYSEDFWKMHIACPQIEGLVLLDRIYRARGAITHLELPYVLNISLPSISAATRFGAWGDRVCGIVGCIAVVAVPRAPQPVVSCLNVQIDLFERRLTIVCEYIYWIKDSWVHID